MTGPQMLGRPLSQRVPNLAEPFAPLTVGATTSYHLPGGSAGSASGGTSPGVNNDVWSPFLLTLPMRLVGIETIVTTGAAGLARLGLYNASDRWNPTTLVVDGGDVDTTGTGSKVVSTNNVVLMPGRYVMAFNYNAAGASFRRLLSNAAGWYPPGGATPLVTYWSSRTYGPFPTTAAAITNSGTSATGFWFHCWPLLVPAVS